MNDPRHPHLSEGYLHTAVAVPVAAPVTAAPQGEAPGNDAPEDLSGLKVADLRDRAQAQGIDTDGLKKADLIDALGGA